MNSNFPTRVRFAPSPTGYLHVGGLRTALYNFLFARHNHGKFLIRIEDTDRQRHVEDATENLLKILKEFGIESDEKVVVQSKRLKIYQKYADELVKSGHAYYCFCSQERLEKMRQEQETKKLPPKYDGRCRNLSIDDVKKNLKEKKPFVIRMKIPEVGECAFNDIVRGQIKFEYKLIDDQVLIKSDGYPTYHLANVVDDHEMKISHVVRGEEWLSSTPKHLLLYKYFNWQPPQFAHLPLLLNPDKSKLSKRQGDVTVEDYLKKGYLKEALINFVAFLGWNPGTDKEIYSLDELIRDFDLKKVQKAGAIFNLEKLDWLNGLYIRKMPSKELVKLSQKFSQHKLTEPIIKLAQDRLKKLSDIDNLVGFIYQDKPAYDPKILIPKKSDKEKTIQALEFANQIIKSLNHKIISNADALRQELDTEREKQNFTRSESFWPLRVAVSGLENSPDVFDIISALGKEKTIQRIKKALALLKK